MVNENHAPIFLSIRSRTACASGVLEFVGCVSKGLYTGSGNQSINHTIQFEKTITYDSGNLYYSRLSIVENNRFKVMAV